jgi:hypothetical protein
MEISAGSLQNSQPKAGLSGCEGQAGGEPRSCRNQDFHSFLQGRMQALIFGYLFIKKKVRAYRRR